MPRSRLGLLRVSTLTAIGALLLAVPAMATSDCAATSDRLATMGVDGAVELSTLDSGRVAVDAAAARAADARLRRGAAFFFAPARLRLAPAFFLDADAPLRDELRFLATDTPLVRARVDDDAVERV